MSKICHLVALFLRNWRSVDSLPLVSYISLWTVECFGWCVAKKKEGKETKRKAIKKANDQSLGYFHSFFFVVVDKPYVDSGYNHCEQLLNQKL